MIVTANRMIVGDGHSVYLDYALRIGEDGRIADFGKKSEILARYSGENVVSYPNSTLLPGLIDMHAHVSHYAPAPRQWQNPFMLAYIAQDFAQRALRRGVTTLRDPGSPHMVTQTMMAAGEMGYMILPRIFPVTPASASAAVTVPPLAWVRAWRKQTAPGCVERRCAAGSRPAAPGSRSWPAIGALCVS